MPERDLPERASMQSELGRPLALSSRLAASWRRSEDYGVSVETVDPVFTGTLDDESLFFSCGREVLTDLHRTLASSPISLMLTDADGLVLNRFCGDHAFLRALDKVHLAPGFSYSEREAGTNGLGLALADRTPTVVRAEEHYSLSLCTYTCAAAPVFDPLTGRLEGSVNITTYAQSSGELLLALAQSAAGNTSALMMARSVGRGRGRRRGARCSASRRRGSSLAPAVSRRCRRRGRRRSYWPVPRWHRAAWSRRSARLARAGLPCWRWRSALRVRASGSWR